MLEITEESVVTVKPKKENNMKYQIRNKITKRILTKEEIEEFSLVIDPVNGTVGHYTVNNEGKPWSYYYDYEVLTLLEVEPLEEEPVGISVYTVEYGGKNIYADTVWNRAIIARDCTLDAIDFFDMNIVIRTEIIEPSEVDSFIERINTTYNFTQKFICKQIKKHEAMEIKKKDTNEF